jgi:hypothetical protein
MKRDGRSYTVVTSFPLPCCTAITLSCLPLIQNKLNATCIHQQIYERTWLALKWPACRRALCCLILCSSVSWNETPPEVCVYVYNLRVISSSSLMNTGWYNFSTLNGMEIKILEISIVIYKYLINVFIRLRSKMQWASYTYRFVFLNAHALEIHMSRNFKG